MSAGMASNEIPESQGTQGRAAGLKQSEVLPPSARRLLLDKGTQEESGHSLGAEKGERDAVGMDLCVKELCR